MKRTLWFLLALVLLLSACGRGPTAAATWEEQYDLGLRYLSEGNYAEAVLAFTTAIEIDPVRAPAYVGRGDAYVGVATLAAEGFEELPDEAVTSYQSAVADYLAAIELDGTMAAVYRKAAEVYLELGDTDSAIAILDRGYEATGDESLLARKEALEPADPMVGEWSASVRYSDNVRDAVQTPWITALRDGLGVQLEDYATLEDFFGRERTEPTITWKLVVGEDGTADWAVDDRGIFLAISEGLEYYRDHGQEAFAAVLEAQAADGVLTEAEAQRKLEALAELWGRTVDDLNVVISGQKDDGLEENHMEDTGSYTLQDGRIYLTDGPDGELDEGRWVELALQGAELVVTDMCDAYRAALVDLEEYGFQVFPVSMTKG